jgi:MtfA peptidase
MLGFLRERRRRRLRASPIPARWREIIERNFALYAHLSEADRAELCGHVQVFLAEKSFEGCGGLELSDEIRVTVAAQACLLLLHREAHYYPGLRSILVYPHAYVAPTTEIAPGGIVVEGSSARLGESWVRGVVVLSWDDVISGARERASGHNVVLHEFAHQLDQEDGRADGAPILEHRGLYTAWARVLSTEFDQLRRDAARGRRNDIDPYGATNAAEFFAVLTEEFFEHPATLKRRHPELYAELETFYKQDPLRLHAT